jgi:hypothetical protein
VPSKPCDREIESADKWLGASAFLNKGDREFCCGKISLFTSQVDSTELSQGLFGREEPEGGEQSGVIPYGDPKSPTEFSCRSGILAMRQENHNAPGD